MYDDRKRDLTRQVAAKTDSWLHINDSNPNAARTPLAESILAVFQAAQQPTDDERDDMIAWLLREQANDLSPLGRDYTDAEVAEALRRSAPPGPNMPSPAQRLVDNRDPECVKVWPECETFGYDPRCCRFPKSCSAGGWAPEEQAANHENGSER